MCTPGLICSHCYCSTHGWWTNQQSPRASHLPSAIQPFIALPMKSSFNQDNQFYIRIWFMPVISSVYWSGPFVMGYNCNLTLSKKERNIHFSLSHSLSLCGLWPSFLDQASQLKTQALPTPFKSTKLCPPTPFKSAKRDSQSHYFLFYDLKWNSLLKSSSSFTMSAPLSSWFAFYY